MSDTASLLPPQNIEAEECVLGSMLMDSSVIAPVFEILGDGEDIFYKSAHQKIYSVMIESYFAGQDNQDVVLVRENLKLRGVLDEVGGSLYLTRLLEAVPTAVNYKHHTEIVLEKSRLRRLIHTATGIVRSAYDANGNANDILSWAENAFQPKYNIQPARALADYYDLEVNHEDTLLGDRFLCREGAMLLVGPSGIGKSSAAVQQDAAWGLGLDAFGIMPTRALRILTIQAENDDADLIEITRGVLDGLKISEENRAALRQNVIYQRLKAHTGDKFFAIADSLMAKYRPDILRIDPLNGYLGGDPKDTELLSTFCREKLNRLLEKFSAACIVNCHTPKTNFRDTSMWKATDWMYSPAGGADLTNWSRAVLVVDPCEEEGLFRFIAAKRGRRIGWRDKNGASETERYFRHSTVSGTIFWDRADNPASSNQKTTADVLNLVGDDPIRTDALIAKAAEAGIPNRIARAFIAELKQLNALYEVRIRRPGVRPEVRLSRTPETVPQE